MTRIANTKETAQKIGLSPRTLERWRLIQEGPPFCKLGSRVVYDLQAVEDWLSSCQSDKTGEAVSHD